MRLTFLQERAVTPERVEIATQENWIFETKLIRDRCLGAPPVASIVRCRYLVQLEGTRWQVQSWARLRLVSEHGGAVLVAGFVIAVLGLLWRMLWYRREVAVIWDEERIFLLGRSEYFPRQFKEELAVLRELLAAGRETSSATPPSNREHAP